VDQKTYDLLRGIPDHADYAAEAGELDAEDIPQERMAAVLDLLRNSDNDVVRFEAAKLLTSWGISEGLVALGESMEKPELIRNTYLHRLYGYDDTYRHILMAVTMYFANMVDRGQREVARAEIFLPLSIVIELAGVEPFEISEVFAFLKRERYPEYIPLVKQHLSSIIDRPEIHRWKIYDAMEFLMGFETEFVMSLLQLRNKSIEDFMPRQRS